jgi:hypothetical protein
MERLHMSHVPDVTHRLRAGRSERRIARDLRISRPTVHKYRGAALFSVLGEPARPPRAQSSVGPYAQAGRQWLQHQADLIGNSRPRSNDEGYGSRYWAARGWPSPQDRG